MSQFPTRTLRMEDMKGDNKEWLPNLLQQINLSNGDITSIANGGLTVGDNISGMVVTLQFATLSNYATGGWTSLSFVSTMSTRPAVMLIGSIVQTKPSAPILTATSLQWTYVNSLNPAKLSIDYVAGLKPNTTYTITVLVL